MKKYVISLSLLLSMMLLIVHYAQAYECLAKKLGWHFYCEPSVMSEDSEREQKDYLAKEKNALDEIKSIQHRLDTLKAQAVLEPTEANIISYITFQRAQLDKASRFAQAWQQTLWKTPALDYSLVRPVSTVAKRAWLDQHRNQMEQFLRNISQDYGIFFVYRSDCPYCHAYAPILKSFANHYGFTVKAITLDGGIIEGWDEQTLRSSSIPNEILLENKGVPITWLFDGKRKLIVPIGYGILSHEELAKRIYQLVNKAGEHVY